MRSQEVSEWATQWASKWISLPVPVDSTQVIELERH